ncbi:hypothetical protein BGZ93_001763 [Podila epicladia]|nr:hypothetical protein BGZ93_001763 [Podila epicladia]
MPDYIRLMAWAIDDVLKAEFLCDPDILDRAACSNDNEGREEFSEGVLFRDGGAFLLDDEKSDLVEVMMDIFMFLNVASVLGACG